MESPIAKESNKLALEYFVPIYGNYYHFMTETALGLYRLLNEHGCVESKECRLWYQGSYEAIVQMFSRYPITHIPISKPYIKSGAELDGSLKTLQHIRIFQHPTGRADLVKLRDFLGRQIPYLPEQKGILVIKRCTKRAYHEHEELVTQLNQFGDPVRVAQMEKLTFCDQVNIMRNSKILIAPHGAGMLNMIFMDRGCRLIELFPKGVENWHAGEIARLFGHQLVEIESQVEGPFHREPPDGVRRWIKQNGWPTRELGQKWRDAHKDIERAVRDVGEFSIPVKQVMLAFEKIIACN